MNAGGSIPGGHQGVEPSPASRPRARRSRARWWLAARGQWRLPAIERITSQPYEEALAEHALAPLGMASGGFGPPPDVWGHSGRMLALGPLGVFDLGRGEPVDPARVESDNPAVMSPAGRLHVSLADWARFQRVFLTSGGDFLRSESVDRMLTPGERRGQRQATGWARVTGREDASFGQQGSNTAWVATAIIDWAMERTAVVVCNEGRVVHLRTTPELALRLLST